MEQQNLAVSMAEGEAAHLRLILQLKVLLLPITPTTAPLPRC